MGWLAPFLALLRAVVDFLAARQGEDARERTKDDGAARAEATTLDVITEKANAQARINAVRRDARSVGERLRDGA